MRAWPRCHRRAARPTHAVRSVAGRGTRARVQITKASKQAEDKGASCEEAAELIATALTAEKPRSRYLFGKSATVQIVARRLLPDRIWDKLVLGTLNKIE